MKTHTDRYSKYIKLLMYVAVIVLINIAGQTLKFRADLTANKIYSLSDISRKVVATLSEPLTIKVFFTKDLPPPHNATEQYLRDLLKEYALHGNKYFNYAFYDVSEENEGIGSDNSGGNRQKARDYGIQPVQIQMYEKDEVKFKQAFMGLVLIHGDIIERIPAITSTAGLEYKLTTAIQKLNNKVSALLKLDGKVQVDLVLSSSIDQVAPYMGLKELKDYPSRIEKIVQDLNPRTYNKLVFKRIDPGADPKQDEDLKKLGVMKLQWPAIDQAGIAPGSGFISLLIRYQKETRVIPVLHVMRIPIFGTQYQLADTKDIEEQINVNLDRLVNINEDLGYLKDFGTLDVGGPGLMGSRNNESLDTFTQLVDKNYTLKDVNLKEQPVPRGLKCLVIARPTEKFSDYALYQIDQALMHGTNLAIFTDAFKESRPPAQQPFMANQMPTYVPMDTGLEKLLDHYGVRIKNAMVLDEKCYRQRRPMQQGGGEQPIYFAPIIQNEHINKKLDYMRNIKGLIALKISPLELDQKSIKEHKITSQVLFSSSDKSWDMRDRIMLNPMFLQPPASDKEMNSQPLAYVLEGSFTSYFKGKPMPEKPVEKKDEEAGKGDQKPPASKADKADLSQITEKGAFREQSPPAKIFVTASSAFLTDQLLDEEGQSGNAMFVLNVIDALNGRESLAAMRSKAQSFNPLKETEPATRTIIKAVNIVGLPILVVLLGLIVWLRRHARSKRIQAMFQE
jgi:gliding motility-associatede transport system auxiliary component